MIKGEPTINEVRLMGRIGSTPDYSRIGNTGRLSFRLATTEHWIERGTGAEKFATEWHDIVTFDRAADALQGRLQLHTRVYIVGSNRTRHYGDQMQRSKMEVHARLVIPLTDSGVHPDDLGQQLPQPVAQKDNHHVV